MTTQKKHTILLNFSYSMQSLRLSPARMRRYRALRQRRSSVQSQWKALSVPFNHQRSTCSGRLSMEDRCEDCGGTAGATRAKRAAERYPVNLPDSPLHNLARSGITFEVEDK